MKRAIRFVDCDAPSTAEVELLATSPLVGIVVQGGRRRSVYLTGATLGCSCAVPFCVHVAYFGKYARKALNRPPAPIVRRRRPRFPDSSSIAAIRPEVFDDPDLMVRLRAALVVDEAVQSGLPR